MVHSQKVSDDETIVSVTGSLYGVAAADLEEKLEQVCKAGSRITTLDLSLAEGITSSAIAKLLSVQKRLQGQNRTIRIRGCSKSLYEIFTKIRLDALIEITPRKADGSS